MSEGFEMGFIGKGQQFLVTPTITVGYQVIVGTIRVELYDTIHLFLAITVPRQETARQKSVMNFNLRT
jgi:hypothetical protein